MINMIIQTCDVFNCETSRKRRAAGFDSIEDADVSTSHVSYLNVLHGLLVHVFIA